MPADGGIGLVEDRPGIEGCLGGAEQALDLEQIAIPQHGLERGHLRVGPHHGDTVVAGFLGKLADIDLEVLAAGLEVTPVGRVADQCLVALLELRLEAGDDRLAVGLVFLGLGVIAADDVAVFTDLGCRFR